MSSQVPQKLSPGDPPVEVPNDPTRHEVTETEPRPDDYDQAEVFGLSGAGPVDEDEPVPAPTKEASSAPSEPKKEEQPSEPVAPAEEPEPSAPVQDQGSSPGETPAEPTAAKPEEEQPPEAPKPEPAPTDGLIPEPPALTQAARIKLYQQADKVALENVKQMFGEEADQFSHPGAFASEHTRIVREAETALDNGARLVRLINQHGGSAFQREIDAALDEAPTKVSRAIQQATERGDMGPLEKFITDYRAQKDKTAAARQKAATVNAKSPTGGKIVEKPKPAPPKTLPVGSPEDGPLRTFHKSEVSGTASSAGPEDFGW